MYLYNLNIVFLIFILLTTFKKSLFVFVNVDWGYSDYLMAINTILHYTFIIIKFLTLLFTNNINTPNFIKGKLLKF